MLNLLKETFERLVDTVDLRVKRGLYASFRPNRLTGLVGPRGVGKTTMMLQYIKEHLYNEHKAFYFSADSVYFQQTTLIEFVDKLYKFEGYRYFFIDEIHQYKNWSQELKNIYDSFPDVHVLFSGSSMIDLIEGGYDLSRRVNMYNLAGMSFREYLLFSEGVDLDVISFDTLQSSPAKFNYLGKQERVLAHFHRYLAIGYYPFIFEEECTYYEKVMRIIKKIIFEDIPNRYDLKTANLHLFQKLLGYLASIPPGEVNINNIAQNLGVAFQTIDHYLHILESVGLVQLVYPFEGGGQLLRKPQKIFIHNTTLLHTLQTFVGTNLYQGTLRELYFVQALRDGNQQLFYSKYGDYRTKEQIFEIGGKNKKGKQLLGAEVPGIIVKDDILVAGKKVIPLFYFGFLY